MNSTKKMTLRSVGKGKKSFCKKIHKQMFWQHYTIIFSWFPKAEDEFVYWPSREESMNCEAFTVTLISKDRLCLSNEEQIIIHDFILEATQVT
jgi:receptor-type tyrosine-protein phosphatase gamma